MSPDEKINIRADALRTLAPVFLNGTLPILAWAPYYARLSRAERAALIRSGRADVAPFPDRRGRAVMFPVSVGV
jgi:hypothetical protein